jgi:ABC-type phosphate transport system substrate-binding protein
MFNNAKRTGPVRLRSSRHKLAIGASAAGALAAVAFVLPAGAAITQNAPPANNLIIGSGSSTDYNMMQSLDTLFNQTPGCVITSGSVVGAPSKGSQQLDYSCEASGGVALEQVPGNDSYLDNPINDVATEQPPMGSSNGIAQLEEDRNNTATGIGTAFNSSGTENVAAINYARSSRDPSGANDIKGLNFVAYAKDGVVPLIFTEFNNVKTPFATLLTKLPGLSQAQLEGIYNGTIYDWGQLGSKTSAPIFVYSAQEGSGTQATFKTFLGNADPSAQTNPVNCTDPVPAGTPVIPNNTTKKGAQPTFETLSGSTEVPLTPTGSTCKGPDVIFENEDASILRNVATPDALATAWQAEQTNASESPVGDSIFFYSFGKFNLQCQGLKEQVQYLDHSKVVISNTKAGSNCGSTPLPVGDKMALTPVGGVLPNAQTIIGTGGTVFPIDRFLYNVYSNGSNTNIPEATAATLNYVSEVGFLCKPQTVDGTGTTATPAAANEITDPANGLWYHTEIFNTILASGFIPVNATDALPTFGTIADGTPIPENAAGGTHTAFSLLSAVTGSTAYGASYLSANAPGQTSNTSIPTTANPNGYCIVSTTDGNANS